MKKSLIAIMLLAGSAFSGLTLSAQTTSCTPSCAPDNCVDIQCDDTCSVSPCFAGEFSPYANLNLSDAQREQLKAIPRPERVAAKERRKIERDSRANYLKSVKEVLTPEQYVQFLENSYVNPAPTKNKKPRVGKDNRRGGKDVNKNLMYHGGRKHLEHGDRVVKTAKAVKAENVGKKK